MPVWFPASGWASQLQKILINLLGWVGLEAIICTGSRTSDLRLSCHSASLQGSLAGDPKLQPHPQVLGFSRGLLFMGS